jgi:hypothetical protein
VARGLEWLALHQSPDGSWSLDEYHRWSRRTLKDTDYFADPRLTGKGPKNDIAGTAFGVLPFLAAGITNKPVNKKGQDAEEANKYVKTVDKALRYLMTKQGKDGKLGAGMYEHGLATIALCEAYGLTSDPVLKRHAQEALNFVVKAQDPAGGGWRYQPRERGDTSVVGWQVMALKSGQMSGLSVPSITLKAAEKFLDYVEFKESSKPTGRYGYTDPEGNKETLTAVGLLCRQYLGTPRRNPALRAGVDWLVKSYKPGATNNIYYEYYATQVMHHMGGDHWEAWNKGAKGGQGIRDHLIAKQEKDGSWNPAGDVWGSRGGRIMQTSLSLLTLEVYYRHLPLYQRMSTTK